MSVVVGQFVESTTGLIGLVSTDWGWIASLGWIIWQLYCPFPSHTTKLQQFHNDLTKRLDRIEVSQVAIAQEVENVSEDEIERIHGQESLDPSDLKAKGD